MGKNSDAKNEQKLGNMQTFKRYIQKLGTRHSTWKVFEDFCAIAAITISNSVLPNQERENDYLSLIKEYTREELDMITEMFADLVLSLEKQSHLGPADILGGIFHDLELHNKYKGQFFTPQHICKAVGAITCPPDEKSGRKMLEEVGYFEVCEPCVGSGAMVLGFANALQDIKLNYCSDMCVTATDIDLKCVHMAYIQLSLYGIPAVVVHGNTITLEEWSHWYTPIYVVNAWDLRRKLHGILFDKAS